MKGLILAAGRGTRLRPITHVVDKALLPIYDKPVVQHVIDTLIRSGINDVGLVLNSNNVESFKKILSFIYPQNNFFYIVKDHDLGMPYSILQAKDWVSQDDVMVIPGDNYFGDDFSKETAIFKSGAVAFTRKVEDPSRFGVAVYDNEKLLDIVEKPKDYISDLAVTAPYIFDAQVFDFIKSLKPSARGELEITEVLKKYLKLNKLKFIEKTTFWKDIGTFDSLLEASNHLKEKTNSF